MGRIITLGVFLIMVIGVLTLKRLGAQSAHPAKLKTEIKTEQKQNV